MLPFTPPFVLLLANSSMWRKVEAHLYTVSTLDSNSDYNGFYLLFDVTFILFSASDIH